jgi:hypothetical protein
MSIWIHEGVDNGKHVAYIVKFMILMIYDIYDCEYEHDQLWDILKKCVRFRRKGFLKCVISFNNSICLFP